ncbi:MAG: tubulin-like doman-containing protein, partial [Tannerella sp.]|nr:tubulin-like doman-containing protein [Tannerella sp.]
MANIFVIGIGGTGMRCIEAFTHLCAIGMFDNTNVHLLALDTDKDNGNFTRLKNLKESYIKTKGVNKKQFALKDTFFSANLHYYQFSPDYSKLSTFDALYNYGDAKFSNPEKAAIADLLFTDNAKAFDLKHGYRAQTHLGSMLMYHSIINEIKQNDKGDLKRFIQELITASNSGNPRIFILGSVFGGTGASSIPIIPKAIKEAAALISNATDIERNA